MAVHKCDGEPSTADVHVNLYDHLLYHPLCDSNDGNLRQRYFPKSPQNHLMYNTCHDQLQPIVAHSTLDHLSKVDTSEETFSIEFTNVEQTGEPLRKCRKRSHYVLKVTSDILCKSHGVSIQKVQNCINRNSSLYKVFSEQLITDGVIMWYQHNKFQNTFLLSDYDPSTGVLTPLSYIHVTCILPQDRTQNKPLVICECKSYNAIKCGGLSNDDQCCADEDTVLDSSMTCMHCRFYTDTFSRFFIWYLVIFCTCTKSKGITTNSQ